MDVIYNSDFMSIYVVAEIIEPGELIFVYTESCCIRHVRKILRRRGLMLIPLSKFSMLVEYN